MITFLVSGAYDDLLQERQRPVDVVCLAHGDACSSCFLCALVASKVDQVKLGCDHFLRLLNRGSAFNMNREDCMRARRVRIQVVVRCRTLLLAFK